MDELMSAVRTHPLPTQEAVRAAFDYDPQTGALYRITYFGVACEPRPTGFVHKDGYRYVKFAGRLILVHRLVWLWMTGDWPSLFIDHINGDRGDPAWANLRLVTPAQSSRNAAAHIGHSCGLRGVAAVGNRWMAQAVIDGNYRKIGTFDDPEEARSAYLRATVAAYGEYVRMTDGERVRMAA